MSIRLMRHAPPRLVWMAILMAAAAVAPVALAESTQAPHRAPARVAACHPRLTKIARGQGSPDDLAWVGRSLLVSDINRGTIGLVTHGHVKTLVAHLREPEGILPGPGGSIIVAEQGTNRVLEIALPSGKRTVLASLPLPPGTTGIDSLGADGTTAVYVPDSARGRLYVLHLRHRTLSLVAKGMTRPVAAMKWHGAVAVADEYAFAVWRVGRTRTVLGAVPVPDDLAVVSGHLIANSLAGQVWEVAPHVRLLSSAFVPTSSDPQGLVADGSDAVLLAVQSRNAIYRLSRLSGCL